MNSRHSVRLQPILTERLFLEHYWTIQINAPNKAKGAENLKVNIARTLVNSIYLMAGKL